MSGGRQRRLTRRGFLGGSALVGAGAAAGAAGGVMVDPSDVRRRSVAARPRRCRSTARIRPASTRRRRTGSRSRRSTSRRPSAADLQDLLRTWTQAAVAMCAGSPGARQTPPRWTRRRRIPVRRKDFRRRSSPSPLGLGPSVFDQPVRALVEAAGRAGRHPGAAARRPRPDAVERRHRHPGLLQRPAGRLPRDPQPGPDRPRRRRRCAGRSSASGGRRRPAPARRRRAT